MTDTQLGTPAVYRVDVPIAGAFFYHKIIKLPFQCFAWFNINVHFCVL